MKQFPYGPCGLFCGACGATDCDGCLGDPVDDSVGKCKFRNCSKDRDIAFCCYCADYPCKELREFMSDEWPHHWTMEPNLEYIKSHGVEKWLQAQRKEWSCSSCGTETFWYQNKCACGQPLEAWEPPE
jgi:hypothetical protein